MTATAVTGVRPQQRRMQRSCRILKRRSQRASHNLELLFILQKSGNLLDRDGVVCLHNLSLVDDTCEGEATAPDLGATSAYYLTFVVKLTDLLSHRIMLPTGNPICSEGIHRSCRCR